MTHHLVVPCVVPLPHTRDRGFWTTKCWTGHVCPHPYPCRLEYLGVRLGQGPTPAFRTESECPSRLRMDHESRGNDWSSTVRETLLTHRKVITSTSWPSRTVTGTQGWLVTGGGVGSGVEDPWRRGLLCRTWTEVEWCVDGTFKWGWTCWLVGSNGKGSIRTFPFGDSTESPQRIFRWNP